MKVINFDGPEILNYKDVNTTMIYTHVLNRGTLGGGWEAHWMKCKNEIFIPIRRS